jgi:hypothetical protein
MWLRAYAEEDPEREICEKILASAFKDPGVLRAYIYLFLKKGAVMKYLEEAANLSEEEKNKIMLEFGYIDKNKYDALANENTSLANENTSLANENTTLKEANSNLVEGAKKAIRKMLENKLQMDDILDAYSVDLVTAVMHEIYAK